MHSNRALGVTTLSIMLILVSLLSAFITPVGAESTDGKTILYFTEYDPLGLEYDYFSETGNAQMSTDPPTKENDSEWPPSLFVKNKLLPQINSEKWLAWFELWVTFKFAEVMLDLGDLDDFAGEDIPDEMIEYMDSFIQTLLDMYNPFKVAEEYTYTGEETSEINGEIIFDLFLKSTSKIRYKDSIKVSISKYKMIFEMPVSEEIKNVTTEIKPTIIPGIIKLVPITLDLEDEKILLDQGDIITFSVEIIPSERRIGKILNRMAERGFEEKAIKVVGRFAEFLSKRRCEKLNNLGDTIKEFLNMSEEFSEMGVNLTLADVADFTDGVKASSFIFASSTHPSKVTLPITLAEEDKENEVRYYLHDESTMDENIPTKEETINTKLSDGPITWSGPKLARNKIIKDVEAAIYLDYRSFINIRKLNVAATLFDGDTEIDSIVKELDRTKLLELLQKKNTLTTFTFSNINYELFYDHNLELQLALSNGSKLGLRKLSVLYDSSDCPSSLKVISEETDNIEFDYNADPSDEKIIPGGSVQYTLNITSKYEDTIDINVIQVGKKGSWEIDIDPESIDISEDGYGLVELSVTSTDDTKDAYGDYIDLSFEVTGKTGKATSEATATVSEDAIKYDVKIIDYTESKTIKKGENRTLSFIIKNNNTGATDDVDSYSISVVSENDWTLDYDDSTSNLRVGTNRTFHVKVFVPKDTSLESDTITFTVTSEGDSSADDVVNVTISVSQSIFDTIYEWFESAAETLGLDEIFGKNAALVLAVIILIIIFFIIIIIALLATNKFVKITCLERIKEINSENEAKFEITLQNPKKRKAYTYELSSKENPISSKWDVSIDNKKVTLGPDKSATVFLTVKPTSHVKRDDWAEVKLAVKTIGKRKLEEISTMTLIIVGKADLKIANVFNWPKVFKPGDKVITSFKVKNNSKIAARNVSVILYINERQKNKVEDITIPGGGYADIKMPWIAVKVKNELHITVKEQ